MFIDSALILYLYILLGNILDVFFIFITLAGFALVITGLLISIEQKWDELGDLFFKNLKMFLWISIPTFLIGAAYPNKEELKFIVGGSTILTTGSAIVNAEGSEKLPQNIVDATNAFLEEINKK